MEIETNTDLKILLDKRSRLRKNFFNHLEQFRGSCRIGATDECGRILFILKSKAERLQRFNERIACKANDVWDSKEMNEDFETSEKYSDEMLRAEYDFQQLSNKVHSMELVDLTIEPSVKIKCEKDDTTPKKRKYEVSNDISQEESAVQGLTDDGQRLSDKGGVRKKIRVLVPAEDIGGQENLRLEEEANLSTGGEKMDESRGSGDNNDRSLFIIRTKDKKVDNNVGQQNFLSKGENGDSENLPNSEENSESPMMRPEEGKDGKHATSQESLLPTGESAVSVKVEKDGGQENLLTREICDVGAESQTFIRPKVENVSNNGGKQVSVPIRGENGGNDDRSLEESPTCKGNNVNIGRRNIKSESTQGATLAGTSPLLIDHRAPGISTHILNGRDVVASPPTAPGKPTVYLRTIINTLLEEATPPVVGNHGAEPRCVVVAPSMALVQQIHKEAVKLSEGSDLILRLACRELQTPLWTGKISDGHHILVCETTELFNLVQNNRISLSTVRYLVLDNVSKMMLKRAIIEVINSSTMPKMKRQILFFSAKFSDYYRKLVEECTTNYVYTIVTRNIKQNVVEAFRGKKLGKLYSILRDWSGERTIILMRTKKPEGLTLKLTKLGLPADSIKYGADGPARRKNAVKKFNSGQVRLLVTSAKGFRKYIKNIVGVAHFIFYDLPDVIEEYAGKILSPIMADGGLVTSFYDPSRDTKLARHLSQILIDNQQEVPSFLSSGKGEKDTSPLADSSKNIVKQEVITGDSSKNVVKHKVLKVAHHRKIKKLIPILRKETPAIVFVKKRIKRLLKHLGDAGLKARHGHERLRKTLKSFGNGKIPILVAKLGAKPFEIQGVAHLAFFDLPTTIEVYKEKISRSFPTGQCGLVTTFYNPLLDAPMAKRLVKVLSDSQQDIPAFLARDAADCQQETECDTNSLAKQPFASQQEAYIATDVALELKKELPEGPQTSTNNGFIGISASNVFDGDSKERLRLNKGSTRKNFKENSASNTINRDSTSYKGPQTSTNDDFIKLLISEGCKRKSKRRKYSNKGSAIKAFKGTSTIKDFYTNRDSASNGSSHEQASPGNGVERPHWRYFNYDGNGSSN